MKGWHWLDGQGLMRDGGPPPPDGEWLVHEGELKMCSSGLHFSKRLIDSLQYAPGNVLCRVECGGEIVEGDDKNGRRVVAGRCQGRCQGRCHGRCHGRCQGRCAR